MVVVVVVVVMDVMELSVSACDDSSTSSDDSNSGVEAIRTGGNGSRPSVQWQPGLAGEWQPGLAREKWKSSDCKGQMG